MEANLYTGLLIIAKINYHSILFSYKNRQWQVSFRPAYWDFKNFIVPGPVVKVPEDAAADHEHEVVHHGQVDNEQPVVVVVLDRDKDTLWRLPGSKLQEITWSNFSKNRSGSVLFLDSNLI